MYSKDFGGFPHLKVGKQLTLFAATPCRVHRSRSGGRVHNAAVFLKQRQEGVTNSLSTVGVHRQGSLHGVAEAYAGVVDDAIPYGCSRGSGSSE